MEDKYSFVISQRARTDLENIYQYISEVLLNPKAADDLMDHFSNLLKTFALSHIVVKQLTMNLSKIIP